MKFIKKLISKRKINEAIKVYENNLKAKSILLESIDRDISINISYLQLLETYFEDKIINDLIKAELIIQRRFFYKEQITYFNFIVSEELFEAINELKIEELKLIEVFKKELISKYGYKIEKFINKNYLFKL